MAPNGEGVNVAEKMSWASLAAAHVPYFLSFHLSSMLPKARLAPSCATRNTQLSALCPHANPGPTDSTPTLAGVTQ